MRSSVKLYRELFPMAPAFRDVSTPCWPEDHNDAESAKVVNDGGDVTALGGDVIADETYVEIADSEPKPKHPHGGGPRHHEDHVCCSHGQTRSSSNYRMSGSFPYEVERTHGQALAAFDVVHPSLVFLQTVCLYGG